MLAWVAVQWLHGQLTVDVGERGALVGRFAAQASHDGVYINGARKAAEGAEEESAFRLSRG
jgi:hypothetical protein